MKLLIVDDEPMTLDMLTTFLEINGYDCSTAENGIDGLTMMAVEKPDLMICDLMMPDIEGYEVCQKVRESDEFSKLPVVILSARTDTDSIQRAYDVGANAYITKPPDLMALLSEVQKYENGVI